MSGTLYEGPTHSMYQFDIIILSFTFLTYEYLPNFEEMWLQLKKKKPKFPRRRYER